MSLFKKKSPEETDVKKIKKEKTSTEKQKKEKSVNTKQAKNLAAKKESEKSEIAKQYGIRISNPYGYFPEDVDRILTDLQSQLNFLSKENKMASDKLERIIKERDSAVRELQTLRMQITVMEVPDTSAEEDFHMMSRLTSINPDVGTIPDNVPDKSLFTGKIEPVIADKIESDDKPKEEQKPQQEVFDNLVQSSKKPKQPINLKNKEQSPQRQQKTKFDLEILGED